MGKNRLEYNEKQGHFHIPDKFDIPETGGWVTIFKEISDTYLVKFFDLVDTLYPDRTGLSLNQVKRLRKAFTKLLPPNLTT